MSRQKASKAALRRRELPNPRVQRTGSSASPLRSPLTRRPLGLTRANDIGHYQAFPSTRRYEEPTHRRNLQLERQGCRRPVPQGKLGALSLAKACFPVGHWRDTDPWIVAINESKWKQLSH